MAFFKFGKASDASAPPAQEASSVDELRRRARHRLIGASVLVLVGVLGFPLVFDTQPRPVAVDIPIEIPDRDKVKPLGGSPAASLPAAQAVAPPVPAAPREAASSPPAVAAAQPVVTPPPPASAVAKPAPPPASSAAEAAPKASSPKVAASKAAAAAPTSANDEAARARALLEGREPPSRPEPSSPVESGAAQGERFIVQVGAFAEVERAREVRQRLERAGLKTYTHVAETKEGRRIRVRVGPFGTRADAERAAQKVKGLELPAAILTL